VLGSLSYFDMLCFSVFVFCFCGNCFVSHCTLVFTNHNFSSFNPNCNKIILLSNYDIHSFPCGLNDNRSYILNVDSENRVCWNINWDKVVCKPNEIAIYYANIFQEPHIIYGTVKSMLNC
jgi:hypothetical protein